MNMNAQALRYKMCRDIEKIISEKLTEFTRETGLIGYPSLDVAMIPAYLEERKGEAILEDDFNEILCYQVLFEIEISDSFGGSPRRAEMDEKEWDAAQSDSEKLVYESRSKK